ncbi:GDP-mannose 4,6-dehydratase [Acidobacteria bacterium AH-259-L09]|nr:GDP-mannose 4,6-dehydratase [Acidobacteria bacterium AH-259-L09]
MRKQLIITGGAGFIGANTAASFLKDGWQVVLLDNFSRKGTRENLRWLQSLKTKGKLEVVKVDVRNAKKLIPLFKKHRNAKVVLHFSGQVAVTTSVINPRQDFEINALGALNVLEAVRLSGGDPAIIYSSTNKVYGGMEGIKVIRKGKRYQYRDYPGGMSEEQPLDFHSPYGCSKGAADQYVRDYYRIYGLKTVVMRQSCIYGYRQFGVEDQGWVAWFTIASVLGKPITIYGDGMQIRDVLFIDDLVRAYKMGVRSINKIAGRIYNIGGGPRFQSSLLELLSTLEKLLGKPIPYTFDDWRPGDQKVFVCDIRKAKKEFGWAPKVSVKEGVGKLFNWVVKNKKEIAKLF